jgi:glycosyltransferase involved in cell wall biosynthesis
MYGWEFPPHISGGLGVACFGMTQALSEQGHEITFVLPRLKAGMSGNSHVNLVSIDFLSRGRPETLGDLPFTLAEAEATGVLENIETRRIDSPLSPYLTETAYLEMLKRIRENRSDVLDDFIDVSPVDATGDYGPNLIEEILRYAKASGSIAQLVPHDIIHTHDWLTVLAGVEAKRRSGKPLVVHIHALEFDRCGENINQTVYDIERYGMEQADRVVAVSHYTKSIIEKRYGIPTEKITVVHNAVTRQNSPIRGVYNKNKKERVVLFLGRITFQKGPDYFVEAAAKVIANRDNVRFVMAGSGDMAPRLIERVAELGLGRKFHFTGFLAGEELEKVFLESDLYVMPSVSEPFGISPLEAMFHDVPVIISNQSGVSEVLANALKFDFWDVDDLASKIIAMLDHSPLREEMLTQGALELKGIQWGKAASTLTELYSALQTGSIEKPTGQLSLG